MTSSPIKWLGSPNFLRGRHGYQPEAIVIHIMQGRLSAADSWFASPKSQVSAHYGIGRTGEIHQYVQEGDAAWHAGRVDNPTWQLIHAGVNPNLYTIGIEHEGESGTPWTDEMTEASASLIVDVANRWSIPLDRNHVIGHREIYSLKPFCPGNGIDLERLIYIATAERLSPTRYAIVASPGVATASTRLNERLGAPTTHANIYRTLNPGDEVRYVGWTSIGESVHGNAHWYQTAEGNFCWAGGTNMPAPAPSALSEILAPPLGVASN